MQKWLTPAVAAVLAGVLFVVARVLDPATVAVLCAQPPAAVPPLGAPPLAEPGQSALRLSLPLQTQWHVRKSD